MNQKITKGFSEVLLEYIVQLKKCNCSVFLAFPRFSSSSAHFALHPSGSATSHEQGFLFCTPFAHPISDGLFYNLVAQFVGIANKPGGEVREERKQGIDDVRLALPDLSEGNSCSLTNLPIEVREERE